MSLLRLAVLGPPEVFHDQQRLTFSLGKAQALLLYLAVEGGLQPRSKLAAFLWPDSEPHAARTSLRMALVLLRNLLADASPSPHSHLLSQQELIGLNPQAPFELDLDVVQQAYHQAQRLSAVPSEPQRASLVAQFQHALAQVRGPFLDGFWLRERLALTSGSSSSSTSGRYACSTSSIGSLPGKKPLGSWSRSEPPSPAGRRSIRSQRRPLGA